MAGGFFESAKGFSAEGGGLNFGVLGGAAGDLLGGLGSFAAAKGYKKAAKFARQNARLAHIATEIENRQQERQIYQVVGAGQAAIGAAGFSLSGSAIDLMKSSAQQGSLDQALISNQGLIEENTYLAQAAEYEAARKGGILGGLGGIVKAGIGIASLFSDERLKTDVRTIEHDAAGRRWVSFRYKWDAPEARREGLIAQEIIESDPQAVSRDPRTDYLQVDYSKLRTA